jgi:hypothetical protein
MLTAKTRKLKRSLESLNDLRKSWGSKLESNLKLDQRKLLRDLSDSDSSHRLKCAATCAGLATDVLSMNQNLPPAFTTTIAFVLARVQLLLARVQAQI